MEILSRLFVLAAVITWSTSVDCRECGNNPMNPIQTVALRTGKSVEHVLSVLSHIDGAAFEVLSKKFRVYASCVGAADTAYFRRRRLPLRMNSDLSEEDPEETRQRRQWEELVVDDDDGRVEQMESWMVSPTS